MSIGPLATAVGTAAAVGIAGTIAMAVSKGDAPRKTLMGTTVIGLPLAGLTVGVGMAGMTYGGVSHAGYSMADTAIGKWGAETSKLTGLSRGGAATALGIGLATGVGIAWLAGTIVLDVNNSSLTGRG